MFVLLFVQIWLRQCVMTAVLLAFTNMINPSDQKPKDTNQKYVLKHYLRHFFAVCVVC